MQFALIDNQRIEAAPGLKGRCPGCSQLVDAKCGTIKIWHWAHRTKITCDTWWERETQWHRDWKNKFDREWHERILFDEKTGEKHIADVRTEHGLVIEFQHSPLDPQERNARENFYGNMVWIVDASHRKNDYKRFLKGFPQFRETPQKGLFLVARPDETFPANWVQSTKPVFFDFLGIAPSDPPEIMRELLWCLLPGRVEGYGVVISMFRKDIVSEATNKSDLLEVLLKGYEIAVAFLQPVRPQGPTTQRPMIMRPGYGPRRRNWRL